MMYPIIKGDQILFSEDVSRPVKPIELEGVTHEEYLWLAKQTEGLVYAAQVKEPLIRGRPEIVCDFGAVAFFREGLVQRNPTHPTVNPVFYDKLTVDIGEVTKLLFFHRLKRTYGL